MSGRLSMWVCAVLCAVICGLVPAELASANTLPDGRSYEQVTPEEKLGSEVYSPRALGGNAEYKLTHNYTLETRTELTFQAAADGRGIAYVAGPTVGGNENEGLYGGNEYLATRSVAGGWSSRVLSPEGAPGSVFQAFSPNLTTAFVDSTQPLASSAPGFGEEALFDENYDVLYSASTAGGEYVPFFTTKPPYRLVTRFGTVLGTSNRPEPSANAHHGLFQTVSLEGVSADDSHLLFAANDALTEALEGRPAAEGGTGAEFENENNLYELANGRQWLVNVLPNGTTHANAGFGHGGPPFSHVISADGSRIFWTDLSSGHIYMREDGASTIEISSEGTYQTATSDGSIVFYTNGDLYADEVQSGHRTDLTPGVTVQRVVGSSENGEYIYYVTGNNELMLWHGGVSTPITTLLETPATEMKAEVTPDGHSVVFTVKGEETKFGELQVHVYVYDAEDKVLYCASCAPAETVTTNGFGSTLTMTNAENVYQPRWISTDGARVFFDSVNGLVPQDTNEVDDVYEWERPGTGNCTESSGCIYLLSGGTSTDNSLFLDASENGEDVFIATRANLVSGDEDGLYDVYDVRMGAGPALVPPVCSGTGCQGAPSAPPVFATPSSVTFEGVGNFAAPSKEAKAKPKPKKKPKPKRKPKKKKSKAKRGARKADSHRRSSSKGGRS